jgi:hypothetical protein
MPWQLVTFLNSNCSAIKAIRPNPPPKVLDHLAPRNIADITLERNRDGPVATAGKPEK